MEYRIHGHDLQLLEVILEPGETVIAEAGAMVFMEEEIEWTARLGSGEEGIFGKIWSLGKRWLLGESLFFTHFTNGGSRPRSVAFAAPYPGTLIPIDLSEVGGEVICQKDAFIAAEKGTGIDIAFQKRLGTGLFGGEGFILERLRGEGTTFLHAGGTVVRKELHGETLRVDTGCLVAFTSGVDYRIALAGGLRSMLFGGEGIFLATLEGTGTVWIQSLPFSRLADRVVEAGMASGKIIPKVEEEG